MKLNKLNCHCYLETALPYRWLIDKSDIDCRIDVIIWHHRTIDCSGRSFGILQTSAFGHITFCCCRGRKSARSYGRRFVDFPLNTAYKFQNKCAHSPPPQTQRNKVCNVSNWPQMKVNKSHKIREVEIKKKINFVCAFANESERAGQKERMRASHNIA